MNDDPMKREGDPVDPLCPSGSYGPYRWEEIEEVLNGTTVPRPEEAGEPPIAPRNCAFCGNPTRWLLWSSHEMTWRGRCGQQGWVQLCEPCHAWYPARLTRSS